MDRRDFLLLRKGPKSRTVELSGEWLYMKWFDTLVTEQLSRQWIGSTESQEGEGPAVFDTHTTKQLLDELALQLRDADTVHVTQMRFLSGDLLREFENLLQAFRARGGTVHIDG